MRIGIAHFTDIHFTIKTNIDNKLGSCINAIKNDFVNVNAIYFVISGDIAFSGIKEEFDLAKIFFNKIKQLIEKQYPLIKLKMIIVPGNHDCYLPEQPLQVRKNSIERLSYESIGDDNSVIDICLTAQNAFWEFYSYYNDIPTDKLFYNINDNVEGKEICFHCINTAWVSQRHENVGSLFFPVKRYDNYNNSGIYLNIGVWHHPYNWFNPNTTENNKREFQMFTEKLASVHFIGHEHESDFYSIKNHNSGDKTNLISGKVFNEDAKPNVSGFETIVVELDKRKGILKNYTWNKEFFDSKEGKVISFFNDEYKRFESDSDFIADLDSVRIPLVIGERRKIRLSEIFVFPDLDAMNSDNKVLEEYQDSENIIDNKYGHSVITGDDQIGKSSLLNIIYLRKLYEGVYPILLNGGDIKDLDLEKFIKRAFRKQYSNGNDNYEFYRQLDKSKKVLLIDDYHNCKLNPASIYSVLKDWMTRFELVIFTVDLANSLLPIMQTEFKDISFYKIKPLGYFKRNEIIIRYNKLKNNVHHYTDDIIEVNEAFDKVRIIMGNKLIPSYPVFILSILQSLDYTSIGQKETSFGFCYQTLIHFSLHKAGVKNENIDTYFHLLTELAYKFIYEEKDVFSEVELLTFLTEYKKKFITPSVSAMIETLNQSRILTIENDKVEFGYVYILYYLSAKKISEILNTTDGKKIVNKLFQGLQDEKNGNILVFVTHHTKDYSFIEDSILNSMVILPEYPPITLETDDPFYSHIKGIADDVSKEILEIHIDPIEERTKKLKGIDKRHEERQKQSNTSESSDKLQEITLPFKQALRSIEIIGQIVRNRKGSLEIPQLKNMIIEVYLTGFRTISYNTEVLAATKGQIIDLVDEQETDEFNRAKIQQVVTDLFMMSSVETCLGIFTKIMLSLGLKDLKFLFTDIGNELNTPAAKLVSFSINSYYGSVSERELKEIINDLKNNPVALKMLRGRMQSYVYSRNLEVPLKQKFASLLGMTVQPSRPGNRHK